MVRDEWARPRYEHRDVRAEYSWRGFRGRPRGWKRRGRWRPRFDRRRWDDDRPHPHGDPNDDYRDSGHDSNDGSPYEYGPRYPDDPHTASDRYDYRSRSTSPALPDTEMKQEPAPEPKPMPDAVPEADAADAKSSPESVEMAQEGYDSDATDEDLTAVTAEALKIQLPPTRVESELMELYSRLSKHNLKYLSHTPLEIPTLAAPSPGVVESIKQHRNQVAYSVQIAQTEYKSAHSKWAKLCSSLDSHIEEPAPTQQVTHQPEVPQSPRHKGGRRNRSYGDAVRSEAEFMEILANLEMETARDPLIRARLTSVTAPPQIFDPREIKAVFLDTNNLVADKSSLLKRLELDNVDTFSEDEHTKFCDAYAKFPKQFGKISAAMGGFRTFHECVMHYYRTKKDFDYKLLVQKRKPKGKRGRKPKKPRVEAIEGEKAKPDDSNDTSMVVESEGPTDTVNSNPEVSIVMEPKLEVVASPVLVEPAANPVIEVPEPTDAVVDTTEQVEPEPNKVTEPILEDPSPESPSVDSASEVLPPVAPTLEPPAQPEPHVQTPPHQTENVEPQDDTMAAPKAAPEKAQKEEAPVQPETTILEATRDPDATVDEPLRKIIPVNETPVKPRIVAHPVAASTPIAPRLMPLRTPKLPKTSSIPPPVQPLLGNRKADPMHSGGIDALATLALETKMDLPVEEKLKSRKVRRRKDVSKPTSYWNAAETKKFETLLGLFGSKWDEIAKHIQSKSAIMLKNHYTKHKDVKGYEEIVKKADTRNAQTGTIPVYVSADPEEVASPTTNSTEPNAEKLATAGSVPEPQPVPTPSAPEGILPQMANGPASGFFEPRQRQLPVQSFHPDEKESAPPASAAAPATARVVTPPALVGLAPEVPEVSEAPEVTGAVYTGIKQPTQPPQPPRPFVRPRTSLLASILHEGAGLPKPKSNFMEADSYKIDTVLPFLGSAPYRESNERGHNS